MDERQCGFVHADRDRAGAVDLDLRKFDASLSRDTDKRGKATAEAAIEDKNIFQRQIQSVDADELNLFSD